MTVNKKLADTIALALKIDVSEVTPELGAGVIDKWDSLGHLEVLMNVEEAFGVRFDTEEMLQYNTVALITDALEKAGAL